MDNGRSVVSIGREWVGDEDTTDDDTTLGRSTVKHHIPLIATSSALDSIFRAGSSDADSRRARSWSAE